MKKVKIEYFTDPLCSSCFIFENVVKKIKLTYGDKIKISFHMGGLLKDWDSFANSKISNPAAVKKHWDELSAETGVYLNSDVWTNDPVKSSYPSCLSYYAAKKFGDDISSEYLSALRKKIFIDGINIEREEVQIEVAKEIGIPENKFKEALKDDEIKSSFQLDLDYGIKVGVKSFPTLLIYGRDNIYSFKGALDYDKYKEVIDKIISEG